MYLVIAHHHILKQYQKGQYDTNELITENYNYFRNLS